MRNTFIAAIAALALITPHAYAQKGRKGKGGNKKPRVTRYAQGVPYTTDIAAAIKAVRKTGKMLAIVVADNGKGASEGSRRLRSSIKTIAAGSQMDRLYYDMLCGGCDNFREIWGKYFVWLDVDPSARRTPRSKPLGLGPHGVRDFEFAADRAGQLLIYRYSGEKISVSPEMHKEHKKRTFGLLEQLCEAVESHGPIADPKKLEPLVKDHDRALTHIDRRRPGNAYVLLRKVVEAGNDKEDFPEGPPRVAASAQRKIDALMEQAATELAGAARAKTPEARQKALQALLKRYGMVPPLKARIQAALDEL